MMRELRQHRARGFTLIELLAAAAILGILATVAVPVVQTTMKREKERELLLALRQIRNAIDSYKEATASGRIDSDPNLSGYPPSLQELVIGVPLKDKTSSARIYFLRRIPRDPFASTSLPAADTWSTRSYDSSAEAPHPGADVFDVASSSNLTGLNGVLYAEW